MQYFLGNQVTIEIANARATTVATSVRKATILHVLNLVLSKHSFRSSDSANSKRAIYAKMFPDSAATSMNCGKTKAMYLAVHGLAPHAKRKLVLDAPHWAGWVLPTGFYSQHDCRIRIFTDEDNWDKLPKQYDHRNIWCVEDHTRFLGCWRLRRNRNYEWIAIISSCGQWTVSRGYERSKF